MRLCKRHAELGCSVASGRAILLRRGLNRPRSIPQTVTHDLADIVKLIAYIVNARNETIQKIVSNLKVLPIHIHPTMKYLFIVSIRDRIGMDNIRSLHIQVRKQIYRDLANRPQAGIWALAALTARVNAPSILPPVFACNSVTLTVGSR